MTSLSTLKFEDNKITFPVGKLQFEDFIKSLLGQPQTLSRFFESRFVLRVNDVGHLVNLINQRVGLQNLAQQVDLTIKYDFSDQSSVTFKSYEAAERYNELKPVVSTAVHLSWVFLIQFPDRPAPEKQEIVVRFIKVIGPQAGNLVLSIVGNSASQSGVFLEVRHTNRSWAIDIESIVVNYVTTITQQETKCMGFLRRNANRFGGIAGGGFMLCSLITAFFAAYRLKKQFAAQLSDALKATQGFEEKVERYLSFVASSASEGAWTLFNLQAAIFLMFSALIALWLVISIADDPKRPASHILLSQAAQQEMDREGKSVAKSARNYTISFVVSVVVGVVSNYVFLWFNH